MNGDALPKILVCTVNAWNEKVGDNTFPLLLQGYPKDRIASLFIREDNPDSPVCDTYFRISEKRVMTSVFKRRIQTGYRVFTASENRETRPKQYGQKSRFYYTKLFCREAVWWLGKWKTAELKEFVDLFAPDIVIYEMSRYIHLNNIVRYILKRSGAVGIGCFWDDTFTYKQERRLGYRCLRFFQRKNLKRLAKDTDSFFAITPKTKKEADAFFKIDATVLTKPIMAFSRKQGDYIYPLKMLYTGNVGIGRLEVISRIVEELRSINSDGIQLTLDVYTNTPLTDRERASVNTEFSRLHPPIAQKEVLALQREADVLLFAESLDPANKAARLSFSTKITDYYAAGRCIFAVGNADLAPMELFADTDSAVVVTDEKELREKLLMLLEAETVENYAQKAHEAGVNYHSYEQIQRIFYNKIFDAYAQKRENKKK